MINAKYSYLVLVLMFFCSCGSDVPVESEFERLKSAHLNIATTLEFTFIPDFTLTQITCSPPEAKILLPAKQWIRGTFDYFEGIDETRSYVMNKSCEAVDATHLKELFEGFIIDKNNNSITFTGWVIVDAESAAANPLMPVNGEIQVTEGAGKFKGVSGSVRMNGNISYLNGLMEWKGDGFIAFKNIPD